MDYVITQESFDGLSSYRKNPRCSLNWNLVYTLPVWLRTWWQSFGAEGELYLRAVWRGEEIIGIAPLRLKEGTASLLGSADVCDFLDFIVAPGQEAEFFKAVLSDLEKQGVKHLDLGPLRPDSTAVSFLIPLVQQRLYPLTSRQEDVSLEVDLPATWEDYLLTLDKKQRHEIRRKYRRLEESGETACYLAETPEAIQRAMDFFLKLFPLSRSDKAVFLTPQMERFFRSLAEALAAEQLLKIGVLELDKKPAALTMCFDYNEIVSLYNNSYDPEYSSLSIGVISKLFCLRNGIERGKKKFDFLKGSEQYKYQLGGKEVPIYRYHIDIA